MPALRASERKLAPSGTSISFFSLTNLTMGIATPGRISAERSGAGRGPSRQPHRKSKPYSNLPHGMKSANRAFSRGPRGRMRRPELDWTFSPAKRHNLSMPTRDFDADSLARYLHITPQQVLKLAERGNVPGR